VDVDGREKTEFWVEVKGWMDPKSATKIKRFKKYFPEHNLIIIDKEWFKSNSAKLRLIIKDWETPHAACKRQIKKSYFKQH
jgi:hypothetical protein